MTNIFVNLPYLWGAAKELSHSGDMVQQSGSTIFNSCAGAPSYEGQFAPFVRGIASEASGRSKNLGIVLGDLAVRVERKANVFWQADNGSLSGLSLATQRIQVWFKENQMLANFAGISNINNLSLRQWSVLLGLVAATAYATLPFFLLMAPAAFFGGARSFARWTGETFRNFLFPPVQQKLYSSVAVTDDIYMSKPEPAPKNMREMAEVLRDLEGDDPVKIYQTGPNEYAVMLRGTAQGEIVNNWNSALNTAQGELGDYGAQVKEYLMMMPEGADIHFVGHSQGGMVGNLLAIDADVQAHLEVQSVTTFGSPVNAPPVGGIPYNRYWANSDIIPIASNQGDLLSQEMFEEGIDLNLVDFIRAEDKSDYLFRPHSHGYSESKYLESKTDLPFGNPTEWVPVRVEAREIHPSGQIFVDVL